jgi:hypothetical protein
MHSSSHFCFYAYLVHRLDKSGLIRGVPLKLVLRYSRMPKFMFRIIMGAWPFLVGGVICLLNCDNERDLDLLNSQPDICWAPAS